MRLSLNWVKDFVDISGIDINKLADRLTMSGTEVESIEKPGEKLKGIVIGEVVALNPHPVEGERLKVAEVSLGATSFVCVTAAQNVKSGDKIPYAAPGAVLADGMELGERDFGGIKSQGMMLSGAEMGLPDVDCEEGILILSENAPLGEDASVYLGFDDTVLELGVTPNRGDCLSVVGMAREISALFGLKRKDIVVPGEIKDLGCSGKMISCDKVEIDDVACWYYSLGGIESVKIAPSPVHVRVRLAMSGNRPISNVVDATNYAMLLLGQPLHAFDARTLPGRDITVRFARNSEKFTTLDSRERILSSKDLLITSGGIPVALAGVMGGLYSEVTSSTSDIALEAAIFEPSVVRGTSRRLALPSEASFRYARGVDSSATITAMKYALGLMRIWTDGKITPCYLSKSTRNFTERSLVISHQKICSLMGAEIEMEKAKKFYTGLGFGIEKEEKDCLTISIPSHRNDVSIEEDMVEELARIWGYENIPFRIPPIMREAGKIDSDEIFIRRTKNLMVSRGFHEVVTYSFLASDFPDKMRLSSDDARANPMKLSNPISEFQCAMRTLMLPGMLEVVKKNLSLGWQGAFRIFEIGSVYPSNREKLEGHLEPRILAGLVLACQQKWVDGSAEVDDFFTLKQDIESILSLFGLKKSDLAYARIDENFLHRYQSALVCLKGRAIGYIGRLKPVIELEHELPAPTYAFEINMDSLIEQGIRDRAYIEPSRFPSSGRDISMIVDNEISSGDVITDIKSICGELVSSINVFDIYAGSNIPEGKKSIAFNLIYSSSERTLSFEEIEKSHEGLRLKLVKLGYTLR